MKNTESQTGLFQVNSWELREQNPGSEDMSANVLISVLSGSPAGCKPQRDSLEPTFAKPTCVCVCCPLERNKLLSRTKTSIDWMTMAGNGRLNSNTPFFRK